ncbi:MAG: ankyrin repeat domain-containing protein [Alphaproteobacteria bacterium]|nr:MAG: ankyrin repeat domain-containing protein [Alphaproteobacteria bacterium]
MKSKIKQVDRTIKHFFTYLMFDRFMKNTRSRYLEPVFTALLSCVFFSPALYAQDIPPPPALDAAEEQEPKLRFNQPSDEMDFTVEPLPEMPENFIPPEPTIGDEPIADDALYGFEDKPKTEDGDLVKKGIDQFFSTTTIVAPDKEKKPTENNDIEDIDVSKEDEEPKKRVRSVPSAFASYQRPPHQFDSVSLPSEIYHRKNSRENRHLPFAYYTQDQLLMLKEAVMMNDPSLLRALFYEKADIHHRNDEYGTLVHLAVRHHKIDALRWLLMYRVEPNQFDAHGLTPLHYAAYAGNLESVELLLTYGADKHMSDASGKVASTYAGENKNNPHMKTILSMLD